MTVGIARPGTVIQSSVDAAWAESRMAQHNDRRSDLGLRRPGVLTSVYDTHPLAPPPSMMDADRPPSGQPDRRASRFRDGLPPPPAPMPPARDADVAAVLKAAGLDPTDPRSIDVYADGVQQGKLPTLDEARVILKLSHARTMSQRAAQLRPQEELDFPEIVEYAPRVQHRPPPTPRPLQTLPTATFPPPITHAPPTPLAPDFSTPEWTSRSTGTGTGAGVTPAPGPRSRAGDTPPPRREADLPHPAGSISRMAQARALTPSQKRRLRRRRSRPGEGDRDPPSAPQLIPPDLGVIPTNGHVHAAEVFPATAVCGHTVNVYLPHLGSWVSYTCSLNLVPHPGQPHLVSAPADQLDGCAELFIGWFAPGE